MAQQSGTGIARAGKRRWGYDCGQVDAFLDRAHRLYDGEGVQLTQQDIQSVSFDLAKGGYVIAQVDAALVRLERAVVDRQTAWELSHSGRVAWRARTEELYRRIADHLERPAGSRFSEGRPKAPSYDRRQVDRLADRIREHAAQELGLESAGHGGRRDSAKADALDAAAVAGSAFPQRRGRKGYDERQVD